MHSIKISRSGLLLTFLLLFISTATFAIQDEAAPADTQTFTIESTVTGWQDTTVALAMGDMFTIIGTGAVNIWPNCEDTKVEQGYPDLDCALTTMGPNGTLAFDSAPENYPYPGALVGALVGRVGDGDAFLVGTGGTYTATTDGLLQFAFNDIVDMEDNFGTFGALVTIQDPIAVCCEENEWVDTGVQVIEAQNFTVTASGTINLWPECEEPNDEVIPCADMEIDANGSQRLSAAPDDYPLPGAPVDSLIGRIGEEGEPFLIGASGTFVAETSGMLQVRINTTGDDAADDTGCFYVVITPQDDGQYIAIPGTLDAWMGSSIRVEAGQTVMLSADGILDIWPRCEGEKVREGLPDLNCDNMRMGPIGTNEVDLAPDDYPLPGARVGALVGRFGQGEPFFVGNGGAFTATEAGQLRFRINDIFGMGDNAGGYVVIVRFSDALMVVEPEQ